MPKHTLVGQRAPEIILPDSGGQEYIFIPGSSGRPTAIFFYPESGTYGCTKEACQFRDALAEEGVFRATNVDVIGISPDPVEKQKKFVDKYNLPYPILSDKEGLARKSYNVNRGLLGLTASSRVTFLIGVDGAIRDVLDSTLNYAAHHKFVEQWLKTLPITEQSASGGSQQSTGENTSPSQQSDPQVLSKSALTAPAAPVALTAGTQDAEVAPAIGTLQPQVTG